mmetsp:Transcript_15686/g.31865  ORF Transcript_15686/g.31865 Transcript_15686/m.31865 type:complete len:232 (-) Transcript_15686:4371-5066(-)
MREERRLSSATTGSEVEDESCAGLFDRLDDRPEGDTDLPRLPAISALTSLLFPVVLLFESKTCCCWTLRVWSALRNLACSCVATSLYFLAFSLTVASFPFNIFTMPSSFSEAPPVGGAAEAAAAAAFLLAASRVCTLRCSASSSALTLNTAALCSSAWDVSFERWASSASTRSWSFSASELRSSSIVCACASRECLTASSSAAMAFCSCCDCSEAFLASATCPHSSETLPP